MSKATSISEPDAGSLPGRALVELNAFSSLVHRVGEAIGLGKLARRRASFTEEAIRSAIGTLAEQGFAPDALDTPLFYLNSSAVLGQVAQTVATIFDLSKQERLYGLEIDPVSGEKTGVRQPRSEPSVHALTEASLRHSKSTTIYADKTREPLIELHSRISIRSGRFDHALRSAGLGDSVSSFVVGHELGHHIVRRCGAMDRLDAFATRHWAYLAPDSASPPEAHRAFTLSMADELYADTVGAMACSALPLREVLSIVNDWRCSSRTPDGTQYLNQPLARSELSEWASGAALDKAAGAPELLARCFWVALAAQRPTEDLVRAKLAERRLGTELLESLAPPKAASLATPSLSAL